MFLLQKDTKLVLEYSTKNYYLFMKQWKNMEESQKFANTQRFMTYI